MHNQLTMLLDLFYAERDPVQRLIALKEIGERFTKETQRMRREAAYEAKFSYSWTGLAEITGMDRKNLESIVRQYFRENPDKPRHPGSHSRGE